MAQVNNPEGINQYTGNRRSIRQTVGFAARAVKKEFSADPNNVGKILFGAGVAAHLVSGKARKAFKEERTMSLIEREMVQDEVKGLSRKTRRAAMKEWKDASTHDMAQVMKKYSKLTRLARYAPPLMVVGGLVEIASRSRHVQAELEHIVGDVRQVSGVKAKTGALFHHMFNHVKRK